MAKTYKLEIVTPERKAFSDEVEMVIARAIDGDIGILADHIPLVTGLDIGILRIIKDGQETRMSVAGGFIEVNAGGVNILTDAAERPEEIDVERARRAKERAERRLAEKGGDIDLARAEYALRRALTRLRLVNDPSANTH